MLKNLEKTISTKRKIEGKTTTKTNQIKILEIKSGILEKKQFTRCPYQMIEC